jgi:zinc-ribbon domain
MFCQKCGTQIPENAAACPACSASTTAPKPANDGSEQIKAASKDALKAFKLFALNPVGGLSVAFESLGQARTVGVGIVFGIAFALCLLFGVYRLLPGWGRPQGIAGFFKILVVAIVPFVSLLGASIVARKAFRANGDLGHDTFIAGASLLPFGCVALLAAILGFGNIEVISVFALFAICLTILMLYAGLTRISKLSEQAATLAVPLMLIASAWLSKIIYTAMLKNAG